MKVIISSKYGEGIKKFGVSYIAGETYNISKPVIIALANTGGITVSTLDSTVLNPQNIDAELTAAGQIEKDIPVRELRHEEVVEEYVGNGTVSYESDETEVASETITDAEEAVVEVAEETVENTVEDAVVEEAVEETEEAVVEVAEETVAEEAVESTVEEAVVEVAKDAAVEETVSNNIVTETARVSSSNRRTHKK